MSNLCNVGEIVFSRKDVIDQADIDDMWDDTALIEAYDQAVNLAYDAAHASLQSKGDAVAGDMELLSNNRFNKPSTVPKENRKERREKRRKRKWKVGDVCLAKYADDGLWYEATIIGMNRQHNKCTIRFNGYDTDQEQNIGRLHRIPESSTENKADNSGDETSSALDTSSVVSDAVPPSISSSHKFNTSTPNLDVSMKPKVDNALLKHGTFMPPPMPPSFLQNSGPSTESEAMAGMLMSWYMSGYHTGYYQAMRDMKSNKIDK